MNHLGKVGIITVSIAFLLGSSPATAIDPANAAAQAVASDGGKEALNAAFKAARSKPALSIAAAAGITCIACVPVAGVVASPDLYIACGILVAKTLG